MKKNYAKTDAEKDRKYYRLVGKMDNLDGQMEILKENIVHAINDINSETESNKTQIEGKELTIELLKSLGVGLIVLAAIVGVGWHMLRKPEIFIGIIIVALILTLALGIGGGIRRPFRNDDK